MNARAAILALAILMAWVLSGCAGTASSGTSRALEPILSSEAIDFEARSFSAWKRGSGYLQIDVDVHHDAGDYQPGFERELQHAAALCAAFANSEIAFDVEWWALKIILVIYYGSEWRRTATYSRTEVLIGRATLLELRARGVPAKECPQYWEITAIKSGPCEHGHCSLSSPWPDSTPAEKER